MRGDHDRDAARWLAALVTAVRRAVRSGVVAGSIRDVGEPSKKAEREEKESEEFVLARGSYRLVPDSAIPACAPRRLLPPEEQSVEIRR
jgi:hypothetical protein